MWHFLIAGALLVGVGADKTVDVRLRAQWNHTSFLAEAGELLADESADLFWRYVDALAKEDTSKLGSHESEYELALRTAVKLAGENRADMIKLGLALRAYSPRVRVLQQIGEAWASDCEGAFVEVNGNIICHAGQVAAALESVGQSFRPYTFEHIHPKSKKTAPFAILYTDLRGSSFVQFHNELTKLTESGKVRYVLRHFTKNTEGSPIGLSGYGVELAIKNTEYKAVDDAQQHSGDVLDDKDIHGLNFKVLQENYPDSEAALKQLKRHLVDLEELSPLKQWEVTDLSYQAAFKVIDSSPEAAVAELLDISQNFPIRARSLVGVRVPEVFREEVQTNQQHLAEEHGIGEGENALLINGVNVEVDQLDVFQLFNTLSSEEKLSTTFYNMGFRREYLSLLYSYNAVDGKTSYAVDYRESYPEYLNNLDKDKQYKDWGNSVKALLQPTYMGMMRPIARNFFTLIFVVDPTHPSARNLLSVGHSLYMHRVPIRIGFVFTVNDNKTVSGLEDAGVALLNLYNFAKSDKESVPKATDLLLKALQTLEQPITAKAVHKFFSKKFPDQDINDVFQADSDYDTGRTAGAAFVRRSSIGGTPKVLLNGVLLDDSMLTPDKIEEAILMQIMRQTGPLQRAVMTGKLTDRDNVQNWVMTQPEVLPRLSRRFLDPPSSVVIFDNVYPCKAKRFSEVAKLSSSEQMQCLLEGVRFMAKDEDDRTRLLTIFLLADLDTPLGRLNALSGLRALKKSKDMRLALVHSGKTDSKLAKFIHALARLVPAQKCKDVLSKKLTDSTWLSQVTQDFSKLADAGLKESEVISFTKEYKLLDFTSFDTLTQLAQQLSPDEGTLLIGNGEVYGPIGNAEALDTDDFLLLEQLVKKRGASNMAQIVDQWGVEKANGKSSDVMLRVWSAFAKFAVKNERKQITLAADSETVLHLLAEDQKRGVLDLTVIVDPLSRGAQKLAGVVNGLVRVVNADVRLIMNPKAKLSELPLKRFFRFSFSEEATFDADGATVTPSVQFTELPNKQLLTLNMIPPDSWMVQPVFARYDLDNLKMETIKEDKVETVFELVHILLEGHCFDVESGSPPRGLQFVLGTAKKPTMFDTIVMANLGYFQLKASPGAWILRLRDGKSNDIYEIHNHTNTESEQGVQEIRVVIDSFLGRVIRVRVGKKEGKQGENLLSDSHGAQNDAATMFGLADEDEGSLWSSISNKLGGGEQHDQINIFSLASGHLYERFMRIMMVSVVKNTKHPVKFWLLNNYLSPQFRESLPELARHFGFEFELVEYKWPRWLHQQTEKQRIMWGYKILFLDVLFPLSLKKIIFVDADQVVRTDMMELMNFDLGGAPYGYTPFCDSRASMDGFRFWKRGYWASHLAGRKYHISALYVVDLQKFRQIAAGDRLRGQYQGLSADPNSLSNLDQDLPNNMIHQVRIKSLPQEWLWCETWCSDSSKKEAKTIDLCNNPETKEPKLDSAVRIIPEWTQYDQEVRAVLERSTAGADKGAPLHSEL